MKAYGEKRKDVTCELFTSNQTGWSGQQSKKVAKRRAKDKKIMHRKERRTGKTAID